MSKLTSWLSANLPFVKTILNLFASSQKPKAKAFIHDKADDFYAQIDHVTGIATISAFEDYLTDHVGDSKLGALVVAELKQLIELGIRTGVAEMGLRATDALTKQELDKITSYIDKQIDGARF